MKSGRSAGKLDAADVRLLKKYGKGEMEQWLKRSGC